MKRRLEKTLRNAARIIISLALCFQGIEAFADTQNGSFIYAATSKPADGLVKFDATSFKLLKTIALPNATSPYVLGVDPSQSHVFVERESASATPNTKRTVDVINTQTDMIERSFDLPLPNGYSGRISDLTFSLDGSKAFISLTENHSVMVLSGDLTRQYAVVDTGGITAWKGTLSPDGAWLYVPNFSSPVISVINTASNVLQGSVNLRSDTSHWSDGSPERIVVSPDGNKVYVELWGPYSNNYNGELLVLQPNVAHDGFTLVKRIVFPSVFTSNAIQLTADGKKLYVQSSSGSVSQTYIVDTETYSVTTKNLGALSPSTKFSMTRDGMRIVAAQSAYGGVSPIVSIDPAGDLVSATTDWHPSDGNNIPSFSLVDTHPICQ